MVLKKTIFNFDIFNRWLTLLTNLGMIAGLALVVYEVRQNTLSLNNSADIAVWNIGAQNVGLVIESSEVAELLVRFETEPWDKFSKVDQMRISILLGSFLDRLELQLRLEERSGNVLDRDDVIFPEYLVKLETFKIWWKNRMRGDGAYPDSFIKFFDAYIKEVNSD